MLNRRYCTEIILIFQQNCFFHEVNNDDI